MLLRGYIDMINGPMIINVATRLVEMLPHKHVMWDKWILMCLHILRNVLKYLFIDSADYTF